MHKKTLTFTREFDGSTGFTSNRNLLHYETEMSQAIIYIL